MTTSRERSEAATTATSSDPALSRIAALPVNRAHRATAQAHYVRAEAIVEQVARIVAICRGAASRMLARRSAHARMP